MASIRGVVAGPVTTDLGRLFANVRLRPGSSRVPGLRGQARVRTVRAACAIDPSSSRRDTESRRLRLDRPSVSIRTASGRGDNRVFCLGDGGND